MPVDVWVEIEPQQITAKCLDFEAVVTGEFEPAQDVSKVEDAAQRAFAKSGDAEVELNSLQVSNPQNLFVPASMFNELRRQLYGQIVPMQKVGVLPAGDPAIVHSTQAKWIVKTDDWQKISALPQDEISEIVYLLSEESNLNDLKNIAKNKIRLALPTVCRKPDVFKDKIEALLAQGYKKWEVGNYWGLEALPEKGVDISFDSSLYTLNTQAIQMAKEMGAGRVTLSLEDTLENMKTLIQKASLPTVMVVYQDVPLFTSAACIRSNACKDCKREEKWLKLCKDGQDYLALSKNCQTMLFAQKPYCVAEFASQVKADFYRADFTFKPYESTKVAQIWESLKEFQNISESQQANLSRLGGF